MRTALRWTERAAWAIGAVALSARAGAAFLGPRVCIEAPVLAGTDRALNRRLGRMDETAVLERTGNLRFAGDRHAFVRASTDITAGDAFNLDIPSSLTQRREERMWIVNPGDVSVLDVPASPVTLGTCYPFLLRRLGASARHGRVGRANA